MTDNGRRQLLSRLLPSLAIAWLSCLALAISVEDARSSAPRTAQTPDALSLFTHSSNCLACHNNLVTASGEDVSIGSMWRGTMMANSARDPYVHASIRRETVDHPSRSAEIEDECAACHMPMLQRVARNRGTTAAVFEHLVTGSPATPLQDLARDGISCSVCHQIADDGLGTATTANGSFVMAPTPPTGVRAIYGAHDIDRGRRTIMRSVTGFEQEEAPHIKESRVCATCHTLTTKAYGPDGAVVGELPEQMTYQEWQHSAFNHEQRSCQSCHMPAAAGPVRISSVLGDARDTLARHTFVGGNAHMLRLMNRYRGELGIAATAAELEAAAQATIRQLQQDTATVSVSTPRREGQTLSFVVEVRNRAGHKFPTGFPSRRAWLHVTVSDAAGRTLFVSGAIDAHGAIQGNDSDTDPASVEPHYDRVTSSDQVQIYESVLGARDGAPTTGLLTATQYLKDNRLLPRGFDAATAPSSIAVWGIAADGDFAGGVDRVRYDVAIDRPAEGLRVDVELRYQAISYRWARNLDVYDAAESRRFVTYYAATASGSSIVVASASAPATP